MAKRRMTFDKAVRFCILLERMAKPGETLAEASERLAAALERCGFRGCIVTAGQGDMDPSDSPDVQYSFGPWADGPEPGD